MRVLITGANGMLARAAIAHCAALGDEVTALTRSELDISIRDHVFANFEKIRPQIILNCAAYTDVDGAESNEEIAYAANSQGPENLAVASQEFGATFVTVSTDYVFDGTKEGFYTQADTPNPQSVYARSKYEGELCAASANSDSILVRSGWIYGSHGTNFLSVLPRLLSEGNHMKAIDDAYGTPTYAADLAVRLRELALANATGIFHVTNSGEGASYLEFAQAVAKIGGFDEGLPTAVSNDDLKRPAARPRNSKLRCDRSESVGLAPLRDWEIALREYLDSI